jgi:hypothetical protein
MTRGIKISINLKQDLYLNSINSKDPKLKNCNVKLHPELLERLRNDNTTNILISKNKTETTWNIVKPDTGKKSEKRNIITKL